MAKPKKDEQPRRRGGRKPGKWDVVTPEQLKEYRATHQVSRARLAQMLGVSSTSVQNWETGTVATTKIQQRLAQLFAAGAPVLPGPGRSMQGVAPAVDPTIAATGTIVASYVQNHTDLEPEELVSMIRAVRQALH